MSEEGVVIRGAGMSLRIVNLVATCDLNCSLHLRFVNSQLPHSKYKPERFSGLSIKFPLLKTSVLLFSNAKVVILGAKSEAQLYETLDCLIVSLNKIGYQVNKSPIKIQNSVYTCNFGFQIDLDSLSDTSHRLFFDPEIFAGIHYKVPLNNSTCVIFHTGRCNILGVKSRVQAEETFLYLQELLPRYKKQKMASQEQRIANALASKEFTDAAQDFLDDQDRTPPSPSVPPLVRMNAMIPPPKPPPPRIKNPFKQPDVTEAAKKSKSNAHKEKEMEKALKENEKVEEAEEG